MILTDHCFVSVSIFSLKLKLKRNRKVLVPPLYDDETLKGGKYEKGNLTETVNMKKGVP